jgi:hypothetical protein
MLDGEDDELQPELEGEEGEEQRQDGEEQLGEVNDDLEIEIEGFDPDAADEVDQDKSDDTPAIRAIRQRNRNLAREKFELQRENERLASGGANTQQIDVGEKPTLEGCDWDEDRFEAELTAWQKRRDDAENQKVQQQQREQEHRQRFDQSLQTMRANAARIAKPEVYQEAERVVGGALPQVLGNAIPIYFKDRAPALVLALHRRPDLLARVAETAKTDMVQAMFDLWDMSKGVKMVKPAKKTFEAEDSTRGSAPMRPVSADKKQEELEKDARKTGDWSKVAAYKRDQDERKRKAA